MHDRSSRPHHSPRRTPTALEQQVVRLRHEHRIGPVRLAARTGILVHRPPHSRPAPPARSGGHRPGHRGADPPLRTLPARRTHPHRRQEARPHPRRRRPQGARPGSLQPQQGPPQRDGLAYLHTALDDHSRLAYTEDLPDEKADTCAGFLRRATAWFGRQGVIVERVLTDNAWAHTKNTWRDTCRDLGISTRWTRPWRPQTNGKVERFHRILLKEWAYIRPYTSDTERQIDGQPPASRVQPVRTAHLVAAER
ncbi:transposase [Streptomyces misionensis JCM 4497]